MFLGGDHVCVCIHRALEVWGSLEALAREKKLRKEAEIEYRESKYCCVMFYYFDFLGVLPSSSQINHIQRLILSYEWLTLA